MIAFSVTEAMVSWLASMGYPASTRPTADAPDEFVTVERTGGGVASMVDRTTMAVQCWGATEDAAEALAGEVRMRLLTEQPPPGIRSVRASAGPYPFFDPNTRRPRYQLVLDVACQLTIPYNE